MNNIEPVEPVEPVAIVAPIYGVYFICCINNYLDIVKEQLKVLDDGLIEVTSKLLIFITNYEDDKCLELDKILNNSKFVLIKTKENLYEKYSINNYKTYITDEVYYLYYFHTKGVSKWGDDLYNCMSSRRKVLNYYTLSKYKINIDLLNEYDAVGCNLSLYPKKHFSGNFWWSKSNYLETLNNVDNGYLSPEMYILSNSMCKYISLTNSAVVNSIDDYNFLSDNEIKNNLTTDFIVIE